MLVGIDMIEIERIKRCSAKPRFMERVFSEKELALFLSKKNPRVWSNTLTPDVSTT